MGGVRIDVMGVVRIVPSVATGTFCKRCDEGLPELSAQALATSFKMEFKDTRVYCPKCINLAYTERAFEKVWNFLGPIESLVHSFWRTDLQVIEGIWKFAELPADYDYQQALHAYEHEEEFGDEELYMLLRFEKYEKALYENDWQGLVTHWRELVFNMLKSQRQRFNHEWPNSTLWLEVVKSTNL